MVKANVNHTAAASYATDAANWDAVSAVFCALAPRNTKRSVGQDELVLVPEDHGAVGDWDGVTGTDDSAAFTRMYAILQTTTNPASRIQLTAGKNYKVSS